MNFVSFYKGLFKKKEIQENNYFELIIKSISEYSEVFVEALEATQKKYQTDEIPKVLNHILMFKLHLKDITTEWQRISDSKDDIQKNLGYRSLCLHLYEFLDKAKAFLGNSFRRELRMYPNCESLCSDLDFTKKWYKALKNIVFNELAEIRHNAIGHKSENSLKLQKLQTDLDYKKIDTMMILIYVFFAIVLRFDDNIISSLTAKQNNVSEDEREKIFKSLQPAKNELVKFMFVLKGFDLKTAELLSKPEVQRKINEIVEYLRGEKDS